MSEPEIVTTSDRPDLDDQARDALRGVWPEFIFHDPVAARRSGPTGRGRDWPAGCSPHCGNAPPTLDLGA